MSYMIASGKAAENIDNLSNLNDDARGLLLDLQELQRVADEGQSQFELLMHSESFTN